MTAVARKQLCKRQVTAGYRDDRGNATVEELWEEVFSVRSAATATSHYNKVMSRRLGSGVREPQEREE
jgi:hypothetical protein